MITIKFEHKELIPKRFYHGNLEFKSGTLTKICGDNGVGKSTFYYYCQQNELKFFSEQVCFLEQKPLKALNNYTLSEIKNLLINYWNKFLIHDWQFEWDKMITSFNFKTNYQVEELSGGQNQLLKLMLSSILNRNIYFWDEPFTALDPQMIKWWVTWIKARVSMGAIFIVIDHGSKLDSIIDTSYHLTFAGLDKVEFVQTIQANGSKI